MQSSKEEKLIKEIVQIGRLIYKKGYSVSIDGNISCRLSSSEILITSTGARLGFLKKEDLSIIDYHANLLRGKKFTSEYDLHLNIYKSREDVNAIIHAHAPNCIALSCLDIDTLHHLYITVAPIPITEFGLPSSKESFERLKPYVKDYNWAILKRHGAIAYEKDLLGAFLRLEGMEHFAKILMNALSVQRKIEPLSSEVKEKLEYFWKTGSY